MPRHTARGDAALLAVLYGGGLRRAEAVALDVAHVDTTDGALVARGKGDKERRVYLAPDAQAALGAWLALRAQVGTTGALFLPVTRGARPRLLVRPLTEEAVFDVLAKRAAQAGVRALSPHDFRRTFIGDLLDQAPTSRPCSSWPGTRAPPRRPATTGVASARSARPRTCSTCRTTPDHRCTQTVCTHPAG
jgi:site-specific recombinase XerC